VSEAGLRRTARAAWSTLRWRGASGLAARAARELLGPLARIQRFVFVEADLERPSPGIEARVPLVIRPAAPEDFERAREVFEQGELDLREARERLSRGEVCVLGLAGGEPVYFVWASFAPHVWIDEIGLTLRLGPHEAYNYQSFTLPRWRGNRIDPACTAVLQDYERARGRTREVGYVRADNVQSLKTVARLGYRKTKTVWRILPLGAKRPFLVGATREGSPSLVR
jgi:ribosomal protein S18 acetylase RimI-like enzyme